MSSEFAFHGLVSIKTDVFSFGVMLLELVSGRKNMSCFHAVHPLNLIGYAWRLWIQGRGLELMDATMDEFCQFALIIKY
ncbi:hypothetical protein SLEP1_g50672 [Rubroshorea leprosula]|nr:hypothetical protein SLEP1_g50672 [Rubroshorea leprosula]